MHLKVQDGSYNIKKNMQNNSDEIQPVQDLEQLAKLMIARKTFLNKLKEEGKDPLAFIGPGIVDNKPAIIVVFFNETAQIRLLATFEVSSAV